MSEDVVLDLLDLLCVYNSCEAPDTASPSENYFKEREKPGQLRKTWK